MILLFVCIYIYIYIHYTGSDVVYFFIAITPRFTLTWIGSSSKGATMGQMKLLNRLLIIHIISYLKPHSRVQIVCII